VTDFAELFYRLLPGIYRDKDARGELRRFVEIMASPAAELEQSIGQLYLDLFFDSCRPELLPLIGDLLGADIEAADPVSIQRTALTTAFASYRSKGLAVPLAQLAQSLSRWTTVTVDFSQVVARVPFLQALNVLVRQRDRSIAEDSPISGRYYFSVDRAVTPLYDERRGRPIARTDIVTLAAAIIGTDAGFAIKDRGVHLVGPSAPAPFAVLAADLHDFADPRTPEGTALVVTDGQVAIDPELGRFAITSPRPLVANVTVDFHQLVSGATVPQTFNLRDSSRMARLARSDDPAPYTLDIRSARRPSDNIGRTHYDNHGFFLTVGRIAANQRPNPVAPGAFAGFTFDNRPLATGDTSGNALQLQDGIDGAPLTRHALARHETELFGTPRGLVIRRLGTSLLDPAFPVAVRIRAADLANFAAPTDENGAALAMEATDVAIDPQRGRFLLDLTALGIEAAELRVGFLLAPAVATSGATPAALGSSPPTVFAFEPGGAATILCDGYDGTPLSAKLRLGSSIGDFHGTPRGYRVSRNGVDLAGTLAPELKSLDSPTATASANRLAIDLDRGRLAFPAGFLAPGDVLTVDYFAEDVAATGRTFAILAQRLQRMIPAGVTPVLIDTRRAKLVPASLG